MDRPCRTQRMSLAAFAFALAADLAGCAREGTKPAVDAAPPASSSAIVSTYVVLGEDGATIARAITTASACPAIRIDGKDWPMQMRAASASIAPRQRAGGATDAGPVDFPVLACEKMLPAQTRAASIGGQTLPLPVANPTRIVVIGDTGCRLKTGEEAQACNEATKYPFAAIAAAAANWKPDLVVHVGDYLYREKPCPDGDVGCAGTPWGYGWNGWNADLFQPGAALLRAAPWVVTRGNHESCNRAGQGWWRFLDPHPVQARYDCNDANDDDLGDYGAPYAVPLGEDAQLIVLDSSNTANAAFAPDDARLPKYLAMYDDLVRLAQRQTYAFLVEHHPVLGLAGERDEQGKPGLRASSRGMASAFERRNPRLLPAQVGAILSGHTHLWEQLSFAGDYPSQFIAGFSGTEEDVMPLPETLPKDASPAPGVRVSAASSWVYGFGFMTLERRGPERWQIGVHDATGALVNDCELVGRQSHCRVAQVKR